MQIKSLLNNEDGSIIVLTLIFLVLLTILGMSATSTSTIEVQIAGNNARAKENLYLAEAAAMEATQRIADADATDLDLDTTSWSGDWLFDDTVDLSDSDVMLANAKISTIDSNTRYGAIIHGIAAGSSLDMSAPSQLYAIDIYGMYSGNGQSHVAIGFRKRF